MALLWCVCMNQVVNSWRYRNGRLAAAPYSVCVVVGLDTGSAVSLYSMKLLYVCVVSPVVCSSWVLQGWCDDGVGLLVSYEWYCTSLMFWGTWLLSVWQGTWPLVKEVSRLSRRK